MSDFSSIPQHKNGILITNRRFFRRCLWIFFLLHTFLGLLRFPELLFEGSGSVVEDIFYFFFKCAYSLLFAVSLTAVLLCFIYGDGKRGWYCFGFFAAGELLSSFLTDFLTQIEGVLQFTFDYLFLQALYDAFLDVLYVTFFALTFMLVFYFISRRKNALESRRLLPVLIGIASFFYLFGSEIMKTIFFIEEVGGNLYPVEIFYLSLFYLLYAIFAFFSFFASKYTIRLFSNCMFIDIKSIK